MEHFPAKWVHLASRKCGQAKIQSADPMQSDRRSGDPQPAFQWAGVFQKGEFMPPDFDDLMRSWIWRPIANCPGRYTLVTDQRRLPVSVLMGSDAKIAVHRPPTARDKVLVVELRGGGGLISYQRSDGGLLHTLNTSEGFARKLAQLGVSPPGR
jgi:hypothetical protein